jgi:carboxymethylenebutenolidase
MNKILCVFLGLLAFRAAPAQTQMDCCAPSATESFAMLASDRQFVLSHPEPGRFHFHSQNGKQISFPAADGTEAYGWEIVSKTPTQNYLLVIHEWWGLNDYIKQESENLWNALGPVNVIAVDLYDKKVATTREDAAKYIQGVKTERAESIIKGVLALAGPNARIYTIGWCFGGGWSLQATLLAGNQAAGCVMFYGMPEKDLQKLQGLHADVLGLFASKDKYINPAIVDEFASNMKKAGKTLIVKSFDADHGFANPSAPSFNPEARQEAWKTAIAFLKDRLE